MLYVEIADTPHTQAQGLMFRRRLASDGGMLFKFSRPQVLKFWGLNTYLPLDIAFVSSEGKITKITSITPMSMRTVSSDNSCAVAIEANEGYFASHGIKEGCTVDMGKDNDGRDVIRFKNMKEKGEPECK